MSDPKYAPYGVDDDPFLTHPAGVGRAPLRADNRYGQPNMASLPDVGRAGPRAGAGASPSYSPHAPAQDGYHPDQGAHHGQFDLAVAPDAWAQHNPVHLSQSVPQYQPPRQYSSDQQQGNFRPRAGYYQTDDTSDDAGYNPQSHSRAADHYASNTPPQTHSAPMPRLEARPEPRFEPHFEPRADMRAPPRLSAPRQTAQPSGYDAALHYAARQYEVPQHVKPQQVPYQESQYAARPAATFAAPPRTNSVRANPPVTHVARQNSLYSAHPSYEAQEHEPGHGASNYAPQTQQRSHPAAPQQPAYAGYDEHGFAAGLMPNSAKLIQWAGAACTVLALIGAVYWGYALAVRDAHGIPVVRAQVDPLRIAPETPGGEISTNQGLAVNNIPAASMTPALSDQITLAPQVVELAPEDIQIVEGGSFAQTTGAGSDAALAGASDKVLVVPETTGGLPTDLTALPDALPEDMPMTDAEAVERALEAALAEGGDPFEGAAPQTADAAVNTEVTRASLAPSETASMAATDPVAPPTTELDPTTIAVGTPMAQLGAFDTAVTARAEWANLQTRFTELMAGKALVVEPAKSGGRDFFRLRAHGFSSEDDTRRFCAAILAENGSCFPVDQR